MGTGFGTLSKAVVRCTHNPFYAHIVLNPGPLEIYLAYNKAMDSKYGTSANSLACLCAKDEDHDPSTCDPSVLARDRKLSAADSVANLIAGSNVLYYDKRGAGPVAQERDRI
jgi:hypothetical protein